VCTEYLPVVVRWRVKCHYRWLLCLYSCAKEFLIPKEFPIVLTTTRVQNSIHAEVNIISPSIAYGKNKMSSESLSNTISRRTKLPSVRITSPVRGQNVPVGKNLIHNHQNRNE
jgi:hypothetical protein